MTVYGFNDRETAIKLKNMVEAGSVMGAAIGDNVFDESGGFAFLNKTRKTIPPFGLLFNGEFQQNEGNSKDYVGRVAYAWSQVKYDLKDDKKGNWFFNNSMPVEPDEWGWSQAKGDIQYGFTKSSSEIEQNQSVFVDDENDFRLFIGEAESAQAETPPGWDVKAQGKVNGEDYGTDSDVFLVPVNEIKASLVLAYGRTTSYEFDSTVGYSVVNVEIEWSSGPDAGQTVTASAGVGYPLTPGSFVTLIKSPIPIPRIDIPDLYDRWAVINYGLTELPFPDDDGVSNPGIGY